MPIRVAATPHAGPQKLWFAPALVLALLSSSPGAHAQAARAAGDTAPAGAPAAAAQPQLGHVLAVQANGVILDLSEVQGLSQGTSVELWRPIKLKHPVTGRTVEDRFQIGRLSITQVRPHMSLAVPHGALDRPAEPGDVVIAPPRAPVVPPVAGTGVPGERPRLPDGEPDLADVAAPDPTRPPAAAAPIGAAEDRDVRELTELFNQLKGATPRARLLAYAGFIKEHRSNRFAPALLEQARALKSLMVAGKGAESAELEHHEPPRVALVNQPLSLAVQLKSAHAGVLVHFKSRTESTFQTQPARRAGRNFFATTLPPAAVRIDGLQYFIEAVGSGGQPLPLVGTAASPVTVSTRHDWDTSTPKRPAATAKFIADYADYNRLRSNDRDWRLEADFGLRLNDVGLRALRSGFGVYRGIGGSLYDLDELNKSPRAVGLTYGYLEAEYAFQDNASLIARTLLGLDDNGVSGGLQGHVRIGSDRGTNVTLGGEILGDIGVRGITELSISPLSRFPIVFRSEVGNQPAGATPDASEVRPFEAGAPVENTSVEQSDVGVRGIVQVGYRLLPELVVSARASYQGRNIKHSGPGFGGAILYSW